MNFRTLIIFFIIIGVIISKNEDSSCKGESVDIFPGNEQRCENPSGTLDFNIPLKSPNNDITIKIPKIEHKLSVEYCGLKTRSAIDYLKCMDTSKIVEMTEKEDGNEYILKGSVTLKVSDYQYVAFQVATNELDYLKIQVNQNEGAFISFKFILFTILLSFL